MLNPCILDIKLQDYIEVPDGAWQILMPNLDSEHKVVLRGCGDGGEGGVSASDDILRVGNGRESECIHYHAGEANYDGHYDSQG